MTEKVKKVSRRRSHEITRRFTVHISGMVVARKKDNATLRTVKQKRETLKLSMQVKGKKKVKQSKVEKVEKARANTRQDKRKSGKNS